MYLKDSEKLLEKLPELLLPWYEESRRDLPWRKSSDAYGVWVSEIMLQQTRVEAAVEYYVRFLSELPTVYDLQACPEEKLYKLWEGLGYYSRVKNMQKTAKEIVEKYGGKFPFKREELKKLCGIGDYTAGAISSIAFYKREPAVDGNVIRVVSRFTENPTPVDDGAYKKELTDALRKVYPKEGKLCSSFTQSLMELGALVCKPQGADHENCPLKEYCLSYRNKTSEQYPVLPEKKEKRREKLFVFVLESPNGISLTKRERGVLKGLNAFPSVEDTGQGVESALKSIGIETYTIERKENFKHVFTHIIWEMRVYFIKTDASPFEEIPLQKIKSSVALPTAFRQILEK